MASLDDYLELVKLSNNDIEEVKGVLSGPSSVTVCVIEPAKSKRAKSAHAVLYEALGNISFQADPSENNARQWFKTDADESFSALLHNKLFARRTLEGRLQRALILHDRGVQINDPMEFFEEITRYKLMQGILPLETIHSAKELDTLVAAYVAWMTVNRSQQITRKGEIILPVQV